MLAGGLRENESKGITDGGKDDAAAVGGSGPRFFENDYIHREGTVQPLSHAGVPDCAGLRGDRGGPVLSEGEQKAGG